MLHFRLCKSFIKNYFLVKLTKLKYIFCKIAQFFVASRYFKASDYHKKIRLFVSNEINNYLELDKYYRSVKVQKKIR